MVGDKTVNLKIVVASLETGALFNTSPLLVGWWWKSEDSLSVSVPTRINSSVLFLSETIGSKRILF